MAEPHFVPGIRNECDGQDKYLSACEDGILVGVEIVVEGKKKKGKERKTNNLVGGGKFALKIKQVW